MAFPTLERSYASIKITHEDNAVKSPMEAGYEVRRPRFTRNRRMIEVKYPPLSSTDKEALITHFNSVGTAVSFTWYDRENSAGYTVYYNEPLSYEEIFPGVWQIGTMKLREV